MPSKEGKGKKKQGQKVLPGRVWSPATVLNPNVKQTSTFKNKNKKKK